MSKIKICLDAGHYGKYNQSPAVKTYYESEMNWKLHNLLNKELTEYGFEVIVTRADQKKDLSLTKRGNASKGCDLFLSIHSNAVGSKVNESVDYPVAYVSINGKGDKLGRLLADCVAKTMGTNQPGDVQSRKGTWGNYDYYSAIKGAVDVGVIGIILEHSFHTNTKATKWLMDGANLAKMAKAEAKVLAEYFGVKKTEAEQPAKPAKTDSDEYSLKQFVKDIQKACGAAVDGIAGPETLGKTVTLSANKNTKHAAVKPVQKRLNVLGFDCGTADGIFGKNTSAAVKAYQKKNGCTSDGVITAKNKTWKKLLGMN